MLRITALLSLSLLLLSSACSKKDKDKGSGSSPTKTTEATQDNGSGADKTESSFDGKLSIDLVMGAKGLVKPFDEWGAAEKKLEAKLGKVTTIHGSDYRWAVLDGDSCAYLSVEKVDKEGGAAEVGAVTHPMTVDKATGPEGNWNECLDSAGAAAQEAPEDPNAPEPPADATPITPADLVAGVAGKKSKWVGATVTLKGFYVSTSTASTSDGKKTVTLSVAGTKGEIKGSIGCTLKEGSEDPKLTQWDEVTLSGKVHDTFGGGMEECELK